MASIAKAPTTDLFYMFWDWGGPATSRGLHGVSTPLTWGNGGMKLSIKEEPKYSGDGGWGGGMGGLSQY
jgi:hypothetical protein